SIEGGEALSDLRGDRWLLRASTGPPSIEGGEPLAIRAVSGLLRVLQRGRPQSRAESWADGDRLPARARFNGAALNRGRRGDAHALVLGVVLEASTGPPSIEGGETWQDVSKPLPPGSFNGAALNRGRRVQHGQIHALADHVLQRGRPQSRAESGGG